MQSFIRDILDRLDHEQGIILPEGRLLVEAFLRSDGSFVFFVSPLECDSEQTRRKDRYYACDVADIDALRRLCRALAAVKESCSVYYSGGSQMYRLVFVDPCKHTDRICGEFGDYCEISPLFAAQTEEYLTAIASGSAQSIIDILAD